MTLQELKDRFPLGCRVRLTADARAQGFDKQFRASTGKVEGYWLHTDLAGNDFATLTLWLYGRNRRMPCQASLWERDDGDSHS